MDFINPVQNMRQFALIPAALMHQAGFVGLRGSQLILIS